MEPGAGELLRSLRKKAGLTQEALAELSQVSVSTIRRLENGRALDTRLGTVNLLADALEAGPQERRQLVVALSPTEPVPEAAEPEKTASSAPLQIPGVLAHDADELAREIRRRWRREEEQRQVHDPFPLPVRWNDAPRELTDLAVNTQRGEPGAAAHELDLSGDLRSVVEVYRRIRSGRLLVLGRAGSGKSILVVRFLLDFLAARTPNDPVPAIFNLSSWDPTATTLRQWMADQLLCDHPYLARKVPSGATLASALFDADLILPVLDGFDEIAEGLRGETLQALNSTSTPLVLTSRRREFAEAVGSVHAPLVWAAGIELSDLTPEDLGAYLPRTVRPADPAAAAGTQTSWEYVLDEMRAATTEESRNLATVLSTPLMVSLARTVYSATPDLYPAQLLDRKRFPTPQSLEVHLLKKFVPTLYRPRPPERDPVTRPRVRRPAAPEHAQRWLGFLAHELARLDDSPQDLAWWRIARATRGSTRLALVVVVSGLCMAMPDLLIEVLTGVARPRLALLVDAGLIGLVAGIAFGTVYGVMAALGGAAFEPTRVRLRLPRSRTALARGAARSFVPRFGTGLLGGAVMGIGYACALTLIRTVAHLPMPKDQVLQQTLTNMLLLGLIFGLSAGLIFGLLSVLEAPLDVTSAATPTALLDANRTMVRRQALVLAPLTAGVVGVGGWLVVELFQGLLGPLVWTPSETLLLASSGGLGGAGAYALCFTAWGQWVVIGRIWLPLTGRLPRDTMEFLDDAYERGALRRTGAVYQFRHSRLQHHLGQLYRDRAGYRRVRFLHRPDTRVLSPTRPDTTSH
ncbi:helix-turn-helix domain-containing protein [Streptomyces violascens]|uniref:XRE family transcriptional regulator n=1 Tax=Streptomyces violascens TaxID=67381 RepID=UPI00378DB5BE